MSDSNEKSREITTVGIIPARGGSKGLTEKMLVSLHGKPLLQYTIDAAEQSGALSQYLVSSEDQRIKELARKLGAPVQHRPDKLARDDTSTVNVVLHVLDQLEQEDELPDQFVLLQPTSPLRTASDIDGALKKFRGIQKETLVSVTSTKPARWCLEQTDDQFDPVFDWADLRKRRQELPDTFVPNGAIYISTPTSFREMKTFYTEQTGGYIMPPERSIDIDQPSDVIFAEAILDQQAKQNV